MIGQFTIQSIYTSLHFSRSRQIANWDRPICTDDSGYTPYSHAGNLSGTPSELGTLRTQVSGSAFPQSVVSPSFSSDKVPQSFRGDCRRPPEGRRQNWVSTTNRFVDSNRTCGQIANENENGFLDKNDFCSIRIGNWVCRRKKVLQTGQNL
jgi:hypothetical protein